MYSAKKAGEIFSIYHLSARYKRRGGVIAMRLATLHPKGLETHNLIEKIARIVVVPLINHIPPFLLKKIMQTTSHDAGTVVKNTGSALALEVMYTRYHRSLFSRGIFQGIADWFWHHLISQPKALRNRLKIVEELLTTEIRKQARKKEEKFTIVTLGGGSSRALLSAIRRIRRKEIKQNLRIVNVDKDERALKLGEKLARRSHLGDIFEWIHDDVCNIRFFMPEESVHIIEMVGLLDYFEDEKAIEIFRNAHAILKKEGLFIIANVHFNSEMAFVYHLGWPKMYYRIPHDLERLMKSAGFQKEISIIFDPLRVHMIATIRK